jgi:peptidoglycan/LPS O-acetylase OafA/YrhL
VSTPTATLTTSAARPSLGYVGALDGVRAVAVIAVVLYHGGVAPIKGGFLGVDVFFVLSGFLITSLLMAELEGSGRLQLLRFYERRARRLLPALVALVVLVTFYAYVVVPHGSFPSLPGQIVGTMLYVGNWTLIAGHTTYFSMGLPNSPLEHTWSLAIEEQFYLVWPVLLLGAWRLTHRHRALAAACAIGAVACAGVTALQFERGTGITSLYFATQTHATTMLVGAAAAFLMVRRSASPLEERFAVAPPRWRRTATVVAVVAWACVLAAFFVVGGTGPFLYRGGYLAFGIAVAAAICATVAVPDGVASRLLASPPMAAIGRISYGIYLYHFPLFLWLDEERTKLSGASLLAVRLGATLLVASASYVLVEQPVRQRRALRGRTGLVAAISGFVAVGVLATTIASGAGSVPFADRLARWNFVPTPPPGTTTTVLVVGDSMAITLGVGLNDGLARSSHLYFAVRGDPDCSLVGAAMLIKDFRVRTPRRCLDRGAYGWPARWSRDLASVGPSVSMVLFRLDVVDHRLGDRWLHVGERRFDCTLHARLVEAAAVLSATGRPVVFLTSPYYDTGEQSDGAPWPEDTPARVDAYNAMLRSVAAEFPDVVHVVDFGAMVSPGSRFTRTIGSVVVRWVDGIHMTYAGDAYVLPKLLPLVEQVASQRPSSASLASLSRAAHSERSASCTR